MIDVASGLFMWLLLFAVVVSCVSLFVSVCDWCYCVVSLLLLVVACCLLLCVLYVVDFVVCDVIVCGCCFMCVAPVVCYVVVAV